MESNILTRQELYELVWSRPITSLTSQYLVTEHFIHKVCRDMAIPLPGIGYWTKTRFGKPLEWEELPSDYEGKNEVIFASKANSDPLLIRQKEIRKDKRLNLIVPQMLTNPDKLVVAASASLNRKQESYRSKRLYRCENDQLDIEVSLDNFGRSLKIFDTLIKAIKIRGHKIEIRYGATNIIVQGQNIRVKLREKTKHIPPTNTSWTGQYIPTGKLYFKIEPSYPEITFKDGKLTLEEQLPSIIANIELLGEKEHLDYLRREKRNLERIEMERSQLALEKRKKAELVRFREMLSKARRLHQTEIIRGYIKVVEENAINNNSLTPDLRDWISWAKRKANWFDPMIEADDELLDGVDRSTLSIE